MCIILHPIYNLFHPYKEPHSCLFHCFFPVLIGTYPISGLEYLSSISFFIPFYILLYPISGHSKEHTLLPVCLSILAYKIHIYNERQQNYCNFCTQLKKRLPDQYVLLNFCTLMYLSYYFLGLHKVTRKSEIIFMPSLEYNHPTFRLFCKNHNPKRKSVSLMVLDSEPFKKIYS